MKNELDFTTTPEYEAWYNANRTKIARQSVFSKGAAVWNSARMQRDSKPTVEFTDGSSFNLIGWAGGAAPGGPFSTVTFEFIDAGGVSSVMEYARATGKAELRHSPATDAADAKDAARYRWLRDKSEPGICAFYLSVGLRDKAFKNVKFARETVDEAIDAQIAAIAATQQAAPAETPCPCGFDRIDCEHHNKKGDCAAHTDEGAGYIMDPAYACPESGNGCDQFCIDEHRPAICTICGRALCKTPSGIVCELGHGRVHE